MVEQVGAMDADTDVERPAPSISEATLAELLPGKSEPAQVNALIPVGPRELDPIREANHVIKDLSAGTKSEIEAYRRISYVLEAFRGQKEKEDAFLAVLVNAHVLPRDEAQLGAKHSSKLSKLRKIGEWADLLLRPEVLKLLAPGYTILYEATLVYEALSERASDEEATVAEFVRHLSASPGSPRREDLKAKRKEIVNGAKVVGLRPTDGSAASSPAQMALAPQEGLKISDLLKAGQKVDQLLLTPRRDHLRLLAEDYPNDDILWRALPLFEVVAPESTVIVLAQLRDLPVIAQVLLPLCGFSKLTHVLLVKQPKSSDVTKAEVIITAERGMRLQIPDDDQWSGEEDDPSDPNAIAKRLAPSATDRLHAFASMRVPGWRSLIGDDTWTEKPSLP